MPEVVDTTGPRPTASVDVQSEPTEFPKRKPRRWHNRFIRRFKGVLLFVGGTAFGTILSKTVELPTERVLHQFLQKESCGLQPGFRMDPLPPGEAGKLRFLNRNAPENCVVLTLELKNDSDEEVAAAKLIITANNPFIAHVLPNGFLITDQDGVPITELLRHFSQERIAQFVIRSIPGGTVFRAYFIVDGKTKIHGFCICGREIVSAEQWSRDIQAPKEIFPFEYTGFEP